MPSALKQGSVVIARSFRMRAGSSRARQSCWRRRRSCGLNLNWNSSALPGHTTPTTRSTSSCPGLPTAVSAALTEPAGGQRFSAGPATFHTPGSGRALRGCR